MAFHRYCQAVINGKSVTAVCRDGEQIRDFTVVGDVVEASRTGGMAARVVGGIYKVGGGPRSASTRPWPGCPNRATI